ncbi:MAG: DUF1127 domain-containing protein [Rhodospirillaceae bacterium]
MLLSMLLNFYRDMRQRQARRAAIRHIAELDDYLLRGIGIQRTDIERYVDGDTPSPSASAACRLGLYSDSAVAHDAGAIIRASSRLMAY